MRIDDRALRALDHGAGHDQEHDDATSATGFGRRQLLRRLGATSAFGAVLVAFAERAASAAAGGDVPMLQTAASIETLAVSTYGDTLKLGVVGGAKANALFKQYLQTTMHQHADHLRAFNAAAVRLGGKAQQLPDPVLNSIVETAKPGLKTPADVIGLVIQLEAIAQQTYVANTSAVADSGARKLFATTMGVEAQHMAVLLVLKALLPGSPQLAALPTDLSKLPDTIGSLGFPDATSKVEQARPAAEGAVQ